MQAEPDRALLAACQVEPEVETRQPKQSKCPFLGCPICSALPFRFECCEFLGMARTSLHCARKSSSCSVMPWRGFDHVVLRTALRDPQLLYGAAIRHLAGKCYLSVDLCENRTHYFLQWGVVLRSRARYQHSQEHSSSSSQCSRARKSLKSEDVLGEALRTVATRRYHRVSVTTTSLSTGCP